MYGSMVHSKSQTITYWILDLKRLDLRGKLKGQETVFCF